MKIAAGIVLYNPDEERLKKCIDKLIEQVEKIYIFDNSSVSKLFIQSKKISYITENKNLGIAYALNRIMEKAKKDNYDWVITMDQDSIIPEDMVSEYKKIIDKNKELGIICPQVIDSRRAYMEIKKKPIEEYIDFCITSASCTSLAAWKSIGGFDEWLFIDLVDNDFCMRLVSSGYKILRLNNLVLNQEFGKIVPKSKKCQKFWIIISKILHNQNFAKFSYKKYVDPNRVYYTCRNIIYVNQKLKKYGSVGYKENYNCKGYFGFVISFIIPSILRSQSKLKVINAVLKGTKEGIKSIAYCEKFKVKK